MDTFQGIFFDHFSAKKVITKSGYVRYKTGKYTIMDDNALSINALMMIAKLKKKISSADSPLRKFSSYRDKYLFAINENYLGVVNLFNYNDKEILHYDIKNCYPTIFSQLFSEILSDEEKIILTTELPKNERLKVIGSLASEKTIYIKGSGNKWVFSDNKSSDNTSYAFYSCVACLNHLNKLIIKELKDAVVAVYMDSIYLKKKKMNDLGEIFSLCFTFENKKISVNYHLKNTLIFNELKKENGYYLFFEKYSERTNYLFLPIFAYLIK